VSFGIYLYRYDCGDVGEADRDAVRVALTRWGWDGSAGCPYQLGTDDGITVEFYASGLDECGEPFYGGNLEVRGFSVALCRLVLDLARAGPFAISHDGDAGATILVSEEQRASLPADMADDPRVMVCETPEELGAALEGGFEAWRAFRDRVCGRIPGGGLAEPDNR
jgi:hypothetical protein